MRAALTALAVAFAGLGAIAPAASAAGGVLVVGDSLEVGTGPYLRRELAGTPVTVDARTGRPSPEAVSVLRDRLRPEHEVVVFDIGVNDDPAQPGRLASDLDAARRIAGDRCMVVATVSGPPLNGVPVAGLNRAIESFASGNPGVEVADWRGAVAEHPGLLGRDRLHPGPDGYAFRARLVAQAVDSCTAAGGAGAASPRSAARPPGPSRAPTEPDLIDWAALARTGTVAAVASYVRGAVALLAFASRHLPGGSEPVLGRP